MGGEGGEREREEKLPTLPHRKMPQPLICETVTTEQELPFSPSFRRQAVFSQGTLIHFRQQIPGPCWAAGHVSHIEEEMSYP